MKYLITGHKGFIGTNLLNYLQLMHEDVIGIDYPINLCSQIPLISSIDVVIHLAAETNIRRSIQCPEVFFISNINSMFTAIKIAQINKAKLVFTSSCGAADSISPYSASKLACEAICRAYQGSFGMNIVILRLSNVYGPYSIHKKSVISEFIKKKLKGEKATIYGTGHQMRDFVHVSDVCKAIYQHSNAYGEISTGHLTSINSIAEMLDVEVEYSNPIDGEILHPETEPWSGCEVSIEEGLKSTLKWFEENLDN